MGLFDKFRSATVPAFDPRRAIMTVVVAAVKADGAVSDEEIVRIRSMCARSPIFATNSVEQDTAIIAFADTVTGQLGEQAIDHAASNLKQGLRETAFAFACDMILADGVITTAEEKYTEMLAAKLAIPAETAQAVVHCTIIRNRSL